MLAIVEPSFKITSYSDYCFEFLDLDTLFESKQEMGLVKFHCQTQFGSILEVPRSRLHFRVIQLCRWQRLCSLRNWWREQFLGCNLSLLVILVFCDTVVEDVQQLTGYDRVMVCNFHDDDHGEVVSETRRPDLEPYLGLHFPATDIPHAAWFLFKQNRVRMICNCLANPVRIIQSKELKQPLCLVNSTLRPRHACHKKYMANMGSIASLVLAIVINDKDSTKLWRLLALFVLQLHMELQLTSQLAEKKVLQMQTLLCDILLRNAPCGIVTQSPSIMDLLKCDGAALYYGGKCWLQGVTPTESQVKDIAK
ncbi:unnamed protein product [Camellia sinensis]